VRLWIGSEVNAVIGSCLGKKKTEQEAIFPPAETDNHHPSEIAVKVPWLQRQSDDAELEDLKEC
jgi:hypothetical protein